MTTAGKLLHCLPIKKGVQKLAEICKATRTLVDILSSILSHQHHTCQHSLVDANQSIIAAALRMQLCPSTAAGSTPRAFHISTLDLPK